MDVGDDVVVVGGETVHTTAIEWLMIGHPAVAESAAVGVRNDELGHAIKAFVVLNRGYEPLDEIKDALIERVRSELGDAAAPRSMVFVESLPKTRSGKLLRRSLLDDDAENH
jgi:acetyl-CoA synthetase